tara:strand:+ start:723 stop:890 length:168 start_codon:yes stop_codon:yes gene_type:complete
VNIPTHYHQQVIKESNFSRFLSKANMRFALPIAWWFINNTKKFGTSFYRHYLINN